MTPVIQTALRQRIRETTVQAILTAAEEVFANNGLHAAHMGEIAAVAGVAVGTLYNHFADRDALLAGLLEARRDELIARIDEALGEAPKAEAFRGRLRAFLAAVLAHKEAHRRFFHILVQGEISRYQESFPQACHVPTATLRELFTRLDKLMKQGVREKALRTDIADLAPVLFMGMVRALMIRDTVGAGVAGDLVGETDRLLTFFFEGGGPMTAPRKPTNKWLVTLSVTFGTLMGAIDISIVAVATPHLRGALSATVEEMTWVTTGFVIATVVVMPLTAFLGRLFGQKRVYLFSLALFVVGSALCGMARTLPMMVAFRALQGMGAGALQPTEQAILRQTFPPEEQGIAMALFGLAVVVGPAIGPTLGGFIIDNYSWPWIFYINLPIGVLALFMVTRFVHEPEDIRRANLEAARRQRGNLDWAGIALMAIGLATLQYVLEEGSKNDWFQSRAIAVCTFAAIFVLAAFVIRELTAPFPAVDLRLFKDGVFLSGTLIGAMMFAILMSITFLLPVFMQELLGFTATQSGQALMPRALAMMVGIPIVGRLYNKVQARILILIGISLVALSTFLMSHYTLETGRQTVVFAIIVQGLGFSSLFVPLTAVALSTIPRYRLSDATGLNSLLRQIGGSLGLATFATLLPKYVAGARTAVASHLSVGRPDVINRLAMIERTLATRGYDASSAHDAAGRVLGGMVMRQATVLAFERMFLVAGIAFLFILPLVFFLKSPTGSRGPKPEVHVEM